MTSAFSPQIGRAYRVAKRPENDEHAHVTVTDVYARGSETVVVFMDGFGSSRTMTLGAFCDFLGLPALKPIPPPVAPAGVTRKPAPTTPKPTVAPPTPSRPTTPPVDF